jgi:Predicted metal-dependent hydrolase
MPPVRPASGEKITVTDFKAGSQELECVVIFSKKRKKTISYTVRYEGPEQEICNDDEQDDFSTEDIKKPILFVRSPAGLSVRKIKSVLSGNEQTIIELLEKATQKEEALLKKSKQTYVNGSIFHYMGRVYVLRLFYEAAAKIQVHLLDGQLKVYLPEKMIDLPAEKKEQKIKKAIENFYIEQADVFFNSRADYFAEKYLPLFSEKPKSVKAVHYKGKWGCCTYQNDIRLNWVLIQAETPVIDYVIIHELCHIKHKNHSKHFWNLVGTIDPDYNEKKNELKENGWILGIKS